MEKQNKTNRRLALLKRAGLFSCDNNNYTITRANSIDDLLDAYRLVHDVFVEQGYIHPQPKGLRIRNFEKLQSTATFIAKTDSKVVGVQSLAIDDKILGLPSDLAFKTEIDILRGNERIVCEATNEAIAPVFRKTSMPTELMRCCCAHALSTRCTDLITTVSPTHVKFYELLEFTRISEIRSYSTDIHDPVAVVHFDLAAMSSVLETIEQDADEAMLFLKRYFIDDNPYLKSINTWEIVAEQNWKSDMFAEVLGETTPCQNC
jgi:hypothetical protein